MAVARSLAAWVFPASHRARDLGLQLARLLDLLLRGQLLDLLLVAAVRPKEQVPGLQPTAAWTR